VTLVVNECSFVLTASVVTRANVSSKEKWLERTCEAIPSTELVESFNLKHYKTIRGFSIRKKVSHFTKFDMPTEDL
jgi:hypothetical protein